MSEMASAQGTQPPLTGARNDEALGWYGLNGLVYVSLETASDPDRLEEVGNHELTHHLLANTTPYGFVQQIIHALAESPYHDSEPELRRAELRQR
jgi:hypothetical protein